MELPALHTIHFINETTDLSQCHKFDPVGDFSIILLFIYSCGTFAVCYPKILFKKIVFNILQ